MFHSLIHSDDVFTGTRVGQSVTYMRSTKSKPQPSNQFPLDKIKFHSTFFSCLRKDCGNFCENYKNENPKKYLNDKK